MGSPSVSSASSSSTVLRRTPARRTEPRGSVVGPGAACHHRRVLHRGASLSRRARLLIALLPVPLFATPALAWDAGPASCKHAECTGAVVGQLLTETDCGKYGRAGSATARCAT